MSHADLEWVPVADEVHHLERFTMSGARVYEAVVAPGTSTAYHRHDRETLYVVLDDSRFRSVHSGGQQGATQLGRSVGPGRSLLWLARRALTGGRLHMPRGTVLLQHHRAAPLIHLVQNNGPHDLRMLGIELDGTRTPPATPPGIRPELVDPAVLVLRVHPAQLAHVPDEPTVIVPIRGIAHTQGRRIAAGGYAAVEHPRELRAEAGSEMLIIYP